MRDNKDREARSLLEQSAQLNTTNDDALLTLGDIAMRRNECKEAAAYYRRMVRLAPERTEGHEKLKGRCDT